MRKYEIMIIIKSDLSEEQFKAVEDRLYGAITSHDGRIEKVDDWGNREFAYEIDHMKKGHYVVVDATASREGISEFERLCRINPNVVRYMVIRKED